MSNIERTLDEAIKHLVAHGNRTPYPDDPRWSPWTRFQKPLIDKLVAARDEHRGAVSLAALREIAREMYEGLEVGSPEQLAVSEFLGRAESLGGQ